MTRMRLPITCAAWLVVMSISAQAGEVERVRKEFHLAIKLSPGLTIHRFGSYENIVRYDRSSRSSLSAGVEAMIELYDKKLYLEIGLLRNELGFKEEVSATYLGEPEVSYIVDQNIYITSPLTLIRQFSRLYVGGGFNASYFLNRRRWVDGVVSDNVAPIGRGFNKNAAWDYWLFGVQAKMGVALPLSSNWSLRSELCASSAVVQGSHEGFFQFGLGVAVAYQLK